MQEIEYKNLCRVSDFPLVVALSMWLSIISIDRTDRQRTVFLFERSEELDTLIERYHQKKLLVEPLTFFYAMKSVKSRLYND